MNSSLEGLAGGRCPHGLYVGLSNFRCKDCEIDALAARLAEVRRIVEDNDQWEDFGVRVSLRRILNTADSATPSYFGHCAVCNVGLDIGSTWAKDGILYCVKHFPLAETVDAVEKP